MESPVKRERPLSNRETDWHSPTSPRSSRAKLTRPPTPGTPPSPLLGATLSDSEYTASATAKNAQIQMKRLLATPLPQAHAFARLSSQHSSVYRSPLSLVVPPRFEQATDSDDRLSDYNVLKLRQLAPAPVPAIVIPPLPLPPRPLLVRSQSATLPTSITSAAKTLHDKVGTSWTMFKSSSQAAVDFIPRRAPTPDIIPRSAPHPSTPPTLSIPPVQPAQSTALTPTLLNFSITPVPPTTSPASSPIKSSPSTDLRTAISEALSTNLARVPLLNRTILSRTRSGNNIVVPPPPPPPTALPPASLFGTVVGGQMMLPGMEVMNGNAVKTSASHPMNISPIIPPEWIPCISASQLPSIATDSRHDPSSASWTISPLPQFDLYRYVTSPSPALPPSQPPVGNIGNFFLSSCPGKKVRLTGAQVKGGRSAICRDLISDFKRAKEFGVSLLVCCLDDEELAFLGAPWEEYQIAARSLSLDIIRIPIAEGYAPNSTILLDKLLSRIIIDYILQGKSVLCSCRGGVGRAGGIALCFLLKFGLLGDLRLVSSSSGGVANGLMSEEDQQLEIVKRAIEVIRRRRSMKAIETPQQVQFILDYVRFLQSIATPVTIPSLLASA